MRGTLYRFPIAAPRLSILLEVEKQGVSALVLLGERIGRSGAHLEVVRLQHSYGAEIWGNDPARTEFVPGAAG